MSTPAALPSATREPRTRPGLSSTARLLILALLLGAWALRLYRLDFQDIWWDEARNIDVATRAFGQIAVAPELDIHPPLYFYILHLWTRLAGAAAFAARGLSAWFGLLVLALVYRLGRGLAAGREGQLAGIMALLLATFSPFGLAEAQETRMYTLAWALLAAAMLALWRALPDRGSNFHRRLADFLPFALLAALSLLSHYATAVALAAWSLWLLVWALSGRRPWARLRVLLGAGLLVALICLPVVPIALRQIPGYDNPNLVLPGLGPYLSRLAQAFTLGEFAPASVWPLAGWVWLALAGGGGVMAIAGSGSMSGRKNLQLRWSRWSLLASWLLGGLAIFYGILVARSAFDPRYISTVLPPLWALAGWGLAGWARLWKPLPWLAVALLLALTLPALRADLLDPAHFREDMRGVVAYLEANSTPEDVILVDQRYPFGFYWPRWNGDFYGFPPDQPENVAPAQYLFVDLTHDDERRLDHRLTALAGDARRVFYVTWFESDMDPRGAIPALLDAYGQRLASEHFRGYSVQTWEPERPVEFQLAAAMQPLDLRFAAGITLVEGDWLGRTQPTRQQQFSRASLRWRADGPTPRPLKVSLRLKDETGATVAQDDRLLLNDRHLRTTEWSPGESALNLYSLALPSRPGVYTLTAVLYDEETLEAVGLSDGSGVEPALGELRVQG